MQMLPRESAAAAAPNAESPAPYAPGPTFESVDNFRDLATSVSSLRAGRLFRSGCPTGASVADVAVLAQQLAIRTAVDLRSDTEVKKDPSDAPYRRAFPLGPIPKTTDQQSGSPASAATSSPGDGRVACSMQLTGVHWVFRLFYNAPLGITARALGQLARGDVEAATLTLVSHLNSKGLLHLYIMFLEYSKSQLRAILDLFTHADLYPLHIYCSLGKDRTGLVSMLVLSCAGATRTELINDYARSRHIIVAQTHREAMLKAGLQNEFLDAPPEVMADTLDYLQRQYGSVEQYLVSAGFSRRRQLLIRANISAAPLPVDSALLASALSSADLFAGQPPPASPQAASSSSTTAVSEPPTSPLPPSGQNSSPSSAPTGSVTKDSPNHSEQS